MAKPRVQAGQTVGDVVIDYRAHLEGRVQNGTLSTNSLIAYTRDLDDFVRIAKFATKIDDIEDRDLERIFGAFASEPDRRFTTSVVQRDVFSGRKSANERFRKVVSGLFTYAVKMGSVRFNPVASIDHYFTAAPPRGRNWPTGGRSPPPAQPRTTPGYGLQSQPFSKYGGRHY